MIPIDAEAANKLAGLQIDTLSKYRAGQLSLDHWERFNNLTPEAREERFGDWKRRAPTSLEAKEKKFSFLLDLGIITVPDGYNHATRLATFTAANRKKFFSFNEDVTDANFSNAMTRLVVGRKLRVRAWKQIVGGTTTSEERMAFLAKQNSIHTGAQGLSLVFEQKRAKLPKGFWYASFDEKNALWEDADSFHYVPVLFADPGGRFAWGLGDFENPWSDDVVVFLSFCDE